MKTLQFALALSLLASGSAAVAAPNFASPSEVSVVVTDQQIADYTGQDVAEIDLRALHVDSDGYIYVFTSDQFADQTNSAFVKIDISGGTPTFETLATQAQLDAAFDDGDSSPADEVAINGIDIASNGDFILSNFAGTDDVVRMTPGTPPSFTKLRQADGVASTALDITGNDVVVAQINNFNAASNDFVQVNATSGGSDVVIASDSAISTVSGGSEAGIVAFGQLSNGDFIVWDESFRDGSDSLLRITTGGTVTVAATADQFNPSAEVSGGIEAITVDEDDNVYAWQEFGADNGLFIFPAPFNPATAEYYSEDAVQSATGFGDDPEAGSGGLAVRKIDDDTVHVFYCDENTPSIVRIVYSVEPASATNWNLYR